jgi:hypothetical protein
MALTDDLSRTSKLRKLSIDDQSAIGDQSSLAGIIQPPVSPFAAQGSAPVDQGQPVAQTAVKPPIMPKTGGLRQPGFGSRAGTGASQTGRLAKAAPSRVGMMGGNGLATDQPGFGNRGGTGASQTGMLAHARKPM